MLIIICLVLGVVILTGFLVRAYTHPAMQKRT
jgi:hypothetical protein